MGCFALSIRKKVHVRPFVNNASMICSQCNQDYPEDHFFYRSKSLGIKHKHCKLCGAKYKRKAYRRDNERHRELNDLSRKRCRDRHAEKIFDYLLEHPCVDCGEANPIVSEFDHRNPGEKFYGVADLVAKGRSWDVISQEMKKCDVRCANCHRIITAKKRNFRCYVIAQQRNMV